MRSKSTLIGPLLGGILAVGAAVVGAAAQDPAEGLAVNVLASDFAFVLDRTIISAGPVQFSVLNTSEDLRHEVWIYPVDERDSVRFQEMLVLKRTGQRANEPDFIDGIWGRSGEIAAGQGATFTIDFLPPGVYEFACLAREGAGDERQVHYDEGMYAALVVRAPRDG